MEDKGLLEITFIVIGSTCISLLAAVMMFYTIYLFAPKELGYPSHRISITGITFYPRFIITIRQRSMKNKDE